MLKMKYAEIVLLLEQSAETELREKLNQLHPADTAQIINELPSEYQQYSFSLLNEENASDVVLDLHDELREDILEIMQESRLVKILDEMDSDEATDLVSELDDVRTEKVLKKLDIIDKEDSDEIRQLLVYDEESAGGLMQKEIIAVHFDMKRDEMIEYIRENYEDVENLHYVFVVDNHNCLVGILELAKILLAQPDKRANEILDKDVVVANVNVDQEEVAHIFRKYNLLTLPIVDDENHLLGRITVDDIIDVIDDEASEDAYKMVGLESEDKVFTNPISSVRKRLPWLALNLLTALLVSSVVGIFEATIARMSFLAVLMPIVAGLGGNSGTQTLTVITRGIAMGELTINNTYRAIVKEVTVGLINGVIIGSTAMLLAFILKGDIMLGVVLGIAMICNMFIAGMVGSLIPVVMKALKFDPALASSVIITMLTDIGGFASFLGLASVLLK